MYPKNLKSNLFRSYFKLDINRSNPDWIHRTHPYLQSISQRPSVFPLLRFSSSVACLGPSSTSPLSSPSPGPICNLNHKTLSPPLLTLYVFQAQTSGCGYLCGVQSYVCMCNRFYSLVVLNC